MSAQATTEFRCRVNRKLVKQAKSVAAEIGTTPGEVVRLLFVQMVKRRAIPFPLQADSPEAQLLGSAKRRAKLWDLMDEGKPATR
jgi:antitoxin component of RelBE/YafQ-DinJ toxin-antitoxin module